MLSKLFLVSLGSVSWLSHTDSFIHGHFLKNRSRGFLGSRERPHDWKKLRIFHGSQVIRHSLCHAQFISWLKEGECHIKFIGSSITVFPTCSPVTAEAPGEFSAAILSVGFVLIFSYPKTYKSINILSVNHPDICTDILCVNEDSEFP